MIATLAAPQEKILCALVNNLSLNGPLRQEKEFDAELDAAGIDVPRLTATLRLHPKISDQAVEIFNSIVNKAGTHSPALHIIGLLSQRLRSEPETTPLALNLSAKHLTVSRIGLATLLGNPFLIEDLLKKGCEPNNRDSQGYTALHIAAMIDRLDLLKLLWHAGGSLKAETDQGLSVVDVLKARGFRKPYEQVVTVFKGFDIPIPNIQRITGRKYLRSNIYSINALLIQWTKSIKNQINTAKITPFSDNVVETYTKIQEGTLPYDPPVYIRKMGPTSPLAGQWELVAKRAIKAGEFVMEYTAQVDDQDLLHGRYTYEGAHGVGFDAEKAGSLAEVANQGPPNCFVISLVYKGLERTVMVAVTPIQEDETIRLNYGRNYFVGRDITFKELNPEKIDSFLRKTKNLTDFVSFQHDESLNNYLPSCQEDTDGKRLPIVKYYVREMKTYLYEFPNHLFKLVEKEKLSKEALLAFFEQFKSSGETDHLGISTRYHASLLKRLHDESKTD